MESTLTKNLVNYDATALVEAIQLGRLSAVEVVQAHFERIKSLNPKYNAMVTLDKERAIARARQADADRARGKIWGPLHGLPITIKDALDTEGVRTTVGVTENAERVPTRDAWVVDKLKRAGAIVIGKTNCARLCRDLQTSNELFGTTNNPWDPSRTSGGSSGGEAVAVALGMSPLGIGSDTMGSIRVPASYCGVFGFKPSLGRVRRDGLQPLHDAAHPWQDSLSVVGPIARSLRDLILCHKVLTDEKLEHEKHEMPPRVYWTQEFGKVALEDGVAAAYAATCEAWARAGANIRKVESPVEFAKLADKTMRLSMFEFASRSVFSRIFFFVTAMRSLFSGGVEGSYRQLKTEQAAAVQRVAEFMKECDCWIIPATASVAFAHQKRGWPIPLAVNGREQKSSYFGSTIGFTGPISFLGNPSIVMPIGENKDGLPIAIQIVGKLGQDLKLLKAAAYLWETANSLRKAEQSGRLHTARSIA